MPNALSKFLNEAAKRFAFKHTKMGAPRYPYNIAPIQLTQLVNEIQRLQDTKGNIVEIGVARGMTTRFLCEHVTNQQIGHTLTLYAIDTFDSFTKADLDFEVKNRGKSLFELKGFEYNDFGIWKRNFSNYSFVKAIKADCSVVDYTTIAPIKLAFLDVDLYLPTKKTLPRIYDALVDGGTILVDDVLSNFRYDGAYQAYMEFCDAYKVTPQIIGRRCGIIYKM